MGELWRAAWRSLCRQRVRTCLTAGSIAVGVILVTVVSSIGRAGTQAVAAELDDLGMSGLSVSAAAGTEVLLDEDSLRLIRGTEGVESAVPLTILRAEAKLRETEQEVVACGIDGGSVQAISVNLRYGRLLTRGDIRSGAAVCVVEETFAEKAYARGNIVGKTLWLRLNGAETAFEIVGVAEAGSSLLQNLTAYIPGVVLIPYTTQQQISGSGGFDQIAVRAAEHTDTEQLAQRIMRTLDRETGTRGQFETENLAMQKSRLNSLMHIVTLILTVISGISLLVSGLGIMTIMLVSVHERVREIGIKKAIGAPRSRILAEFLAESAVLSLLGSVAGLAVGLGVSWAGLSAFHVPFAPEGGRMLLLVLFCIAIGALFGVYPALQAARMRPVDALRQE